MKILVVEDEDRIASFLEKGLREAGFQLQLEMDGDRGYETAREGEFDAIVLDIMLPGRDGLSILGKLRQQGNPVPVILLTARGELDEKIQGLELGADDYLTKPFYIEELVARLHALGRRNDRDKMSLLAAHGLSLNLLTREVKYGAEEIELTVREFSLLEYLLRSQGRVLTRTQILEHVWSYDFDPETNLVDVYVGRLRKKIGDVEDLIQTVRGVGYRIRKEPKA